MSKKKQSVVIQMEGGLGKQVALSSLVPYFKERYEKVIVLSSYPAVFQNNPDVYRAISFATPYAFEEYFKPADDIVYPCGYRDADFRKRRIPLVKAACNSINIPYEPEIMKPSLHLTETENSIVKQTVESLGSYIIVQFHGATSPGGQLAPNIMAKDYDLKKAEELVSKIKLAYPELTIINYSLPGEAEVKGTVKIDYNWPIWFGLVRECETFIAIDSSLQHISAAWNKKGIVLWGATNPDCFGWPHNVNMAGSCPYSDLHCSRPYFVPSVDLKVDGSSWECPTKACMKFSPDDIFNEFNKLGIKASRKPTMELTTYTSLTTTLGGREV